MNRYLHRCSLYYNNGEGKRLDLGKRHPDETRLLVVEMSHDEVYFNFFIIFGKLSFCVKSDGKEISTKILISWQELKNRFLSFFVHK